MECERPAVFTRRALAERWNTSEDTLDRMHARGEGPKRFQISPRRVGYTARDVFEFEEGKRPSQAAKRHQREDRITT